MITIDLKGPEGNSYFLLMMGLQISRLVGLDFEKIEKEMKKSDYENLLNVFKHYFSEYVVFLN